jgi:hypothetical protein
MNRRDHLQSLDVDERIILKWRVWTGFIRLRIMQWRAVVNMVMDLRVP